MVDLVNGTRIKMRHNPKEIAGAVQFFRRACFESIGGLTPLPAGGWDVLTAVQARMKGFKTETFAELPVDHLKPRNVAVGHPFRRAWQMGVRDYGIGYDPGFEFLKCLGRYFEPPLLLGSVARLGGFFWSCLNQQHRLVPAEIVRFIRHEQRRRIRSLIRL